MGARVSMWRSRGQLVIGGAKPFVILVAGVNGSGKTTTIGKLAAKLRAEGRSVMLAAGDTFRAAAIEQLEVWGRRAGIEGEGIIGLLAVEGFMAVVAIVNVAADAGDVLSLERVIEKRDGTRQPFKARILAPC